MECRGADRSCGHIPRDEPFTCRTSCLWHMGPCLPTRAHLDLSSTRRLLVRSLLEALALLDGSPGGFARCSKSMTGDPASRTTPARRFCEAAPASVILLALLPFGHCRPRPALFSLPASLCPAVYRPCDSCGHSHQRLGNLSQANVLNDRRIKMRYALTAIITLAALGVLSDGAWAVKSSGGEIPYSHYHHRHHNCWWHHGYRWCRG